MTHSAKLLTGRIQYQFLLSRCFISTVSFVSFTNSSLPSGVSLFCIFTRYNVADPAFITAGALETRSPGDSERPIRRDCRFWYSVYVRREGVGLREDRETTGGRESEFPG